MLSLVFICMLLYWYLLTLVFCPVFWWQGKQVKKGVTRLPEAAGPRMGALQCSGMAHEQVGLSILICGDSAAAGTGITQQDDALTGHLTRALARQQPVKWQLLAKSGISCDQLSELLLSIPEQQFDQIYISIGVNNTTSLTSDRQYQQHCRKLLTLCNQRFKPSRIILSAIPPMQHFTALPWPLNHWLGVKARLLNRVLAQELHHWPNAVMAKASIPLNAELLAADGFHPSEKGAELWAHLLVQSNNANKNL